MKKVPIKNKHTELTNDQIARITHVRISPGIGIARVGNSKSEYYIGPEVINPVPVQFGQTRDKTGAIKRQVARFRIYGFDKNGEVVAEIQQSKAASIEWAVHVANRKAQWYEFDAAMDIPVTAGLSVPLRNPDVKGSKRDALAIDSGEVKISGLNVKDEKHTLAGNFQGTPVTLGELRTDECGRLLVFPGYGVSASPKGTPVFEPNKPSSFNNAAGWYDDIADGPVHAKVTIGKTEFVADSAWVASGPPNFAPDIVGWRTMNDLLQQVYTQAGMLKLPETISFTKDVWPILSRLNELQWVNKGFSAMFGADAPMNFADPMLVRKLATSPSNGGPDPYNELRRTVYNSFRATNAQTVEEGAWPWIYGDAFGFTNPNPSEPPSPTTYLNLPPIYDLILSKWMAGDFIDDYDVSNAKYQSLENIPLQEQPNMLDQAAMHFCLADAFHPGAELTWPMRHASMYRAPYRIRERAKGVVEPSYGSQLTTEDVSSMNGPLYAQGPGDLSRWMAVPWQGDTAYCRSGYDLEYDPYLPTFWPARVPNQVLTKADYDIVCDKDRPMSERIAAFHNRPSWLRQLPASKPAPEQMKYMIEHFSDMGILEAMKKPSDIDWLPDLIYVENLTLKKEKALSTAQTLLRKSRTVLSPREKALEQAGWASEEHLQEFMRIKRRGR